MGLDKLLGVTYRHYYQPGNDMHSYRAQIPGTDQMLEVSIPTKELRNLPQNMIIEYIHREFLKAGWGEATYVDEEKLNEEQIKMREEWSLDTTKQSSDVRGQE